MQEEWPASQGSVPGRASSNYLIALLAIIFEWYEEHPEAFAMFLVQVFVMYFVCTAKALEICSFGITKEPESLMNEYIVHKKICKAIHGDAYSDV